MGQVFGRDPRSFVRHDKHGPPGGAPDGDSDLASLHVVVDGVGQQVGHHLAELFGIPAAGRCLEFRPNFNPAFGGERADQIDAIVDHLGEVKGVRRIGSCPASRRASCSNASIRWRIREQAR